MKALMSVKVGGPDSLEMLEVADQQPSNAEVLISVKACAINYPDVLIIEDLYQVKPTRPFAPGCEVAGIVEAVGDNVSGFKPGDRVIAMAGHGGLAQQVRVPASSVFALPAEFDFAEGSALLMTYGTSIHALIDRGRIQPGENMLVLGASGGVGMAAVELGKALGANVVAGVSSAEKGEFARAAGADDVVIYSHDIADKAASKELAQKFKFAAGAEGFDVIFDTVGGNFSEPALRSIAWEGRFLVVGFPAGIAKLPLNLTLLKSCDVCGVFWGAFAARSPKANGAHVAHLFELWGEGKIKPHVSEIFDFADGGKAIAQLANRTAMGKLVVRIAD